MYSRYLEITDSQKIFVFGRRTERRKQEWRVDKNYFIDIQRKQHMVSLNLAISGANRFY